MTTRGFALSYILMLFAMTASAQMDQISKTLGLGNKSGLSDSKIASGLKEALQVGTTNAVKLTGRRDGYFGNEAIKILMPKNLRPLEKGLRAVGYGPKLDGFVLSMNRSAEAAAPAGKKDFHRCDSRHEFRRRAQDSFRRGQCGHRLFQGKDFGATDHRVSSRGGKNDE